MAPCLLWSRSSAATRRLCGMSLPELGMLGVKPSLGPAPRLQTTTMSGHGCTFWCSPKLCCVLRHRVAASITVLPPPSHWSRCSAGWMASGPPFGRAGLSCHGPQPASWLYWATAGLCHQPRPRRLRKESLHGFAVERALWHFSCYSGCFASSSPHLRWQFCLWMIFLWHLCWTWRMWPKPFRASQQILPPGPAVFAFNTFGMPCRMEEGLGCWTNWPWLSACASVAPLLAGAGLVAASSR